MKKVLIVCAHPGDEVLGCGGTIALHRLKGDSVKVMILGDGWSSRISTHEKAREAIDLDVLEKKGHESLSILGTDDVQYLRFPDNRFDMVSMLDLVKEIERVKGSYAPELVYTNSPFDLSVDQEKTCRAVVTAFRPQPGERCRQIFAFEVLSSTEWNLSEQRGGFSPNYFVNIESVLAKKIEAFARLDSELRTWPHPRSREGVEFHARTRGALAGVRAAEAFMLLYQLGDI